MEYKILEYDNNIEFELELLLPDIKATLGSKAKNTKNFYNIPMAFDTETTSMMIGEHNDIKFSFVYAWAFGIGDVIVVGRTLEDFSVFFQHLAHFLQTGNKNHIGAVVYVHNLGFDFQMVRKYLHVTKVFSMDRYETLQVYTEEGLEFRCSYKLTGFGLAKLGEQTESKKLVGDLDYKLVRHSKTPLTEEEKGYIVNDIKVLLEYIGQQIKKEGGVYNIPLTKTGYVRRDVRNRCLNGGKNKKYIDLMNSLTIEPGEYMQLRRAFQGGFTHAGCFRSGRIQHNVQSWDFTSAYPYAMMLPMFPMTKGKKVKVKNYADMKQYMDNNCCVFDIRFHGLDSKYEYEHYLSVSHCSNVSSDCITDNGRVISAKELTTTITELDFRIMTHVYSWESFEIANFTIYKRGYLPKEIINSVLYYYNAKTTLKGVKGKEEEYQSGKANLNSNFGMMVTDPLRSDILYDKDAEDPYKVKKPNIEEATEHYNNSSSRFTFYPWGVYITAVNRLNLWSGILELGADYIYSDTDSIKCINKEKHTDYVKKYNENVMKNLEKTAEYLGVKMDVFSPLDIKGIPHPLGVWDDDGFYVDFKTLGAKRYLKRTEDDELELTVSGVSPKNAVQYIENVSRETMEDPFDLFSKGLHIPGEETGKNIHTYIDVPLEWDVTDYMGNTCHVSAPTGCHISPSEYNLTIAGDYENLLLHVQELFEKFLEMEK